MKISFMKRFIPTSLILDVDGVLTDGKFLYSEKGKIFKQFGPNDHEALKLLPTVLSVVAVTADQKGFSITRKRVQIDMDIPLNLVNAMDRVKWIDDNYNLATCIYMGDGIHDDLVFKEVGYSIAPRNAFYTTRRAADFVTKSAGGDSAVAEACLHILRKFYGKTNRS
jgi:3-deoxy-D-manno-octulosonate 8-phosphate phosphatase (KDO 8-P phosphatase)